MSDRSIAVSVIVPNYNYARFLRQRIDSILAQTYDDYEIILLDDASSDESVSILNNYRDDARVTHIEVNTENSGSPFSQWLKGITLAKGRYIWIAESDDVALPTFLECAVSALDKNISASFAFVGSNCIDADNKPLAIDFDHWSSRHKSYEIGHFDGNEYIEHNLYWRNYIYNASGVVFRKAFFDKIVDFSCFSMRYSGDWLFWVEMARVGSVIEIYQKLNIFRQHKNSTTKQSVATGAGIVEDILIVKKIEEYSPQIGSYKRRVRRGSFVKKIGRLKASPMQKKALYESLYSHLGGTIKDYYIERFNKMFSGILPWVITCKRDRL